MLRILFVIVLLAAPVAAQQAPPLAMTPSPNISGKYPKSKAIAVGLEILVPILGHGYAGDAKKGVPPALVTLAGYVMIGATLDDDGEIKKGKEGAALAGGAAALVGRAWALVQVSKMVEAHNRGLTIEPLEADRLGAKFVLKF